MVVGKHLGADSLQRWLTDQGWPTTRLASAKGFRVLETRPRLTQARGSARGHRTGGRAVAPDVRRNKPGPASVCGAWSWSCSRSSSEERAWSTSTSGSPPAGTPCSGWRTS